MELRLLNLGEALEALERLDSSGALERGQEREELLAEIAAGVSRNPRLAGEYWERLRAANQRTGELATQARRARDSLRDEGQREIAVLEGQLRELVADSTKTVLLDRLA
jgi:hypothetical protein